jgi:hypothetical protein
MRASTVSTKRSTRNTRTLDELRGLARVISLTVNVAAVAVWAENAVQLTRVVAGAVHFTVLHPHKPSFPARIQRYQAKI